jgi:hypothetical protein
MGLALEFSPARSAALRFMGLAGIFAVDDAYATSVLIAPGKEGPLMDIVIVGTGNVGRALATGWRRAGHHLCGARSRQGEPRTSRHSEAK